MALCEIRNTNQAIKQPDLKSAYMYCRFKLQIGCIKTGNFKFTRRLPAEFINTTAKQSTNAELEAFLNTFNSKYASLKHEQIFWIIQDLKLNFEKVNSLILQLHMNCINQKEFGVEYMKITITNIMSDDEFQIFINSL